MSLARDPRIDSKSDVQTERTNAENKPVPMLPIEQAVERLKEKGYEGTCVIRPPTFKEKYRDRSMVIVCPTRGQIPTEVVEVFPYMAWPMNQRRNGPMFAKGYEVGHAYNALIAGILEHPILKTWKYVMTFEDDNILPYDAPLRLLETLEAGPNGDGSSEWDAVSGIYFTKDALHAPMAYGDPEEFRRTGRTNYMPIDLSALDLSKCKGQDCKSPKEDGCPHVVEATGIALGCAVWKLDMFREIPPPWFMTIEDKIQVNGELLPMHEADRRIMDAALKQAALEGKKLTTQDFVFADRAVRPPFNKRFAVDLRVSVGHLDVRTGRVY